MRILGLNAVFHDPAAALVVDGEVVAAAEEERFSRRKHGKDPVPFSTWELPALSAAWCLSEAGITADELDAVAYSYDPSLAPALDPTDITADGWEGMRTFYAQRAPQFLQTALPGLDPACVRYVPHHIAHAASAHLASLWVQPAAGDAGTALGAALHVAHSMGDKVSPMASAALGRGWEDADLEAWLVEADVAYERPADIADAVAGVLAANGIVAWFQGRSEYGPRALGHRSLLANPAFADNLERLNRVKGREEFRPVAPMVLADRAAEIFEGVMPSPYMLFTHRVNTAWAERIPAALHVDGTARIQTVDPAEEPLVARMLASFAGRTGVPVVINTSLNTAGRPMVDDPRDALECFGSAPVDALALGPFVVHRRAA